MKNLSLELARIIEAGIDRQLNQSIFYSPFRLFLNLFKKKNPQLINQIRQMLSDDISKILMEIDGFDVGNFMNNGHFNENGNLLIKRCYNIGIRVVKKLTVKMAFKAIRDRALQQDIYDYILRQVKEKAMIILQIK